MRRIKTGLRSVWFSATIFAGMAMYAIHAGAIELFWPSLNTERISARQITGPSVDDLLRSMGGNSSDMELVID